MEDVEIKLTPEVAAELEVLIESMRPMTPKQVVASRRIRVALEKMKQLAPKQP